LRLLRKAPMGKNATSPNPTIAGGFAQTPTLLPKKPNVLCLSDSHSSHQRVLSRASHIVGLATRLGEAPQCSAALSLSQTEACMYLKVLTRLAFGHTLRQRWAKGWGIASRRTQPTYFYKKQSLYFSKARPRLLLIHESDQQHSHVQTV
jgi:hypothetical protein